MEISINNEPIDITFEQEKNLGEILGILESECEKAGSTITRIKIDGNEVSASGLDDYFVRPPESVEKIELFASTSSDIRQLIKQSGRNFSEAAVRMKEISIQLQTGKDSEAIDTINFFAEELQSLHKLLPLFPLAFPGREPFMIDETPLVSFISELTPFLQDFLGGLKDKDTILVGDVAEYELAPRIERLGAFLEVF